MPERLYRSSDVPEYGTYPESPRSVTTAEGIFAQSRAPFVDGRKDADGASKVERLKAKASDAMETVSARAVELKDQAAFAMEDASVRATEWKDEARATGAVWMEVAKRNASRASEKAREYSRTAVRDYPLHVIAGAAVFGLLAGVGLRMWRANRV